MQVCEAANLTSRRFFDIVAFARSVGDRRTPTSGDPVIDVALVDGAAFPGQRPASINIAVFGEKLIETVWRHGSGPMAFSDLPAKCGG